MWHREKGRGPTRGCFLGCVPCAFHSRFPSSSRGPQGLAAWSPLAPGRVGLGQADPTQGDHRCFSAEWHRGLPELTSGGLSQELVGTGWLQSWGASWDTPAVAHAAGLPPPRLTPAATHVALPQDLGMQGL